MTAPGTDVLALAAFRRLANALREAAVEVRGPVAARDSALHEAGQAVDELADLILAEVDELITVVIRPATPAETERNP